MERPPKFLDPFEETRVTEDRLPHWQQDGATYFITFRQYDSLPISFKRRWDMEKAIWLRNNPEPWPETARQEYHTLFSWRLEQILDNGHGSCAMRDPHRRRIVEDCLMFRNTTEYYIYGYVIMPNHAHILASILPGFGIGDVLGDWKGITSHRLNKSLGRSGTFWLEDYRDRMIRDLEHFVRCVRYIRKNPRKAGLMIGEFSLYESVDIEEIE
jgi:putative transposase